MQKEKPETIEQLVKQIQKTYTLSESEILELVVQLENEGKIRIHKTEPVPSALGAYMFSSAAAWFWATIAIIIATAVASFTIPEDSYPLIYLRQILGVTFILLLPGYTFIKVLFPTQVPFKTASENLDTIERIALSIGMSLALVPLVGLLLNYTPWGITLTPIVLSLMTLSTAFAVVAAVRERYAKLVPTNKPYA